MRIPQVVGNWKMHGTRASIEQLVTEIRAGEGSAPHVEIAVCPAYVYLGRVAKLIEGSHLTLGAQNLSEQVEGAYTGEVSGRMLHDYGCRYVIIGHSERRRIYGETDALVGEKFETSRNLGLEPIVCIGESLEEREAGRTAEVVTRQLETVMNLNAIAEFGHAVIAYEPVWAIGTGKTATPEQAQEVHALVRQLITARDTEVGDNIRILYGGSVTGGNAASLFAMHDVDGGLVGGASLRGAEFLDICRAADDAISA